MNRYEIDRELEHAVFFLTEAMKPHRGVQSKAVSVHSIRVALSLYDYGDRDLMVAAALHDLVEDANVPLQEIEQAFGTRVAQLVAANSYDTSNPDKRARNMEMLARCKAYGKDALLIKAADIVDNSFYYPSRQPPEHVQYLVDKMAYFVELSRPELGEEPIWQELAARLAALSQEMPPIPERQTSP